MKEKEIFKDYSVNEAFVYHDPAWVVRTPDYEYKVSRFGHNIIIAQAKGTSTLDLVKKAIRLNEDICAQFIKNQIPYVQIEDYQKLNSATLEMRQYFIRQMKIRKNLIGLIFCHVSPVFKISIQVGTRLNRIPFQVEIVSNLDQAVQKAQEILNHHQLSDRSDEKLQITTRPEWKFQIKGFRTRFEIIDHCILHIIPDTELQDDEVSHLWEFYEMVFEHLENKLDYYILVNMKAINSIGRKTRISYYNLLKKWYQKHPFQAYVIYNVSPLAQAAVQLARPFSVFRIRFASDLKKALKLIHQLKLTLKSIPIAVQEKRAETPYANYLDINAYTNDVINFVAEMDWKNRGVPQSYATLSRNHPFQSIFHILALIKQDVDDLLLERRQNEIALNQANEEMEQQVLIRTNQLSAANTELKQKIIAYQSIERELSMARRSAETANRAKSEFLANMSHEIRTPLNAVMGFIKLILETDLSAKQIDYLKNIQVASKTLLEIINDILDFSKIEAGRLEIENVDFNLNQVIEDISSIFAKKTEEKGIEFVVPYIEGVPHALVGDPLRLGQVLTNLVGNAVKFTHTGEIIVLLELVEKGFERVKLKFTVKDNGIGIQPEKLTKLFAPFTQADGSTTREYGGTGLGLSICKQLVSLMHGDIWVESEVGIGSSFYFTAVFGRQTENIAKQMIIPLDLQDINVLVVDDNESSRTSICDLLDSFGISPLTAVSGIKALEVLESNTQTKGSVDLIIMDWKMPEMDGITAATIIKENSRFASIPIILLTAYEKETLIPTTEPDRIDLFLTKPMTRPILYRSLMKVFGRHILDQTQTTEESFIRELVENKKLEGISVLLVEDSVLNLQVASEIMECAGIRVATANNGQEAVEAVFRNKYDAVLMDIQMPIMDGFDATDRIRREERLKNIPIIAMTAHAMSGDKEKCLDAGMNDYIAKPINVDQLFSVLFKWVSQPNSVFEKQYQESKTMMEKVSMNENLDIPGIDFPSALKRLRGKRESLIKILKLFIQENVEKANQIRDAIEKNEFNIAKQMVHTIKGESSNISALDLAQRATDLDDLLKQIMNSENFETTHLEHCLIEFEQAFDTLVTSIKNAF